MAANDYYGNPKPTPSPSPSPYPGYEYNAHNAPDRRPTGTGTNTPAPSYHSKTSQPNNAVSPFETVFDDHVYPLDPRPHASNPPNMSSHGRYQQDTGYYSPSPASTERRDQFTDDIPLQNRPPKDVEPGNDHVYDAPESGRPTPSPAKRKKKGNIRIGQLGMIGADNAKRIPWVVYFFSIVQVAVFIGEVARNGILTGSPIMIRPFFNPMIGPSTFVLINMGARYTPCMHNIPIIQGRVGKVDWPCPNSTELKGACTLSDLCGFGGVPEPNYDGNENQKPEPNQWFRFITPIFMHAGLIHIGFNLLLQLTIGKEMEKAIGSIRFFLVYVSAGIFGNVFGGNYAGDGVPSTGASSSLFGVIALILLDLLYSWQERKSPVKDLLFIILDIAIAFVLGLLPGLDNFAHIGGFIMGLGLGVCVLHSPNALRRRIGHPTSYATVQAGGNDGPAPFHKNPTGFFKGRKPLWWAWWLVRAGSLLAVIIGFIVLLNNFYKYHSTCSWCRYLSCLPVGDWCKIGELQIDDTEGQTTQTLPAPQPTQTFPAF